MTAPNQSNRIFCSASSANTYVFKFTFSSLFSQKSPSRNPLFHDSVSLTISEWYSCPGKTWTCPSHGRWTIAHPFKAETLSPSHSLLHFQQPYQASNFCKWCSCWNLHTGCNNWENHLIILISPGEAYFAANPNTKGGSCRCKVIASRSVQQNTQPTEITTGSFEGIPLQTIPLKCR